MFLKKIQSLAVEWNISIQSLQELAEESLRYGMRLNRDPKKLKRIFKKMGQDDLLAVKLWAGNYYLLIHLPSALQGHKIDAVAPEDLEYAKTVLTPEELAIVRGYNIKPLQLLSSMKEIKSVYDVARYNGRFLSTLDPMRENTKNSNDLIQDLMVDTLVVANRTMSDWTLSSDKALIPFLAKSIRNKAKSALKRSSPKLQRLFFQETDALQKFLEQRRPSDPSEALIDFSPEEASVKVDLEKILGPLSYRGLLLIMDKATPEEAQAFEQHLVDQGVSRDVLPLQRLKDEIERYLGYKVFHKMRKNESLHEYLSAA